MEEIERILTEVKSPIEGDDITKRLHLAKLYGSKLIDIDLINLPRFKILIRKYPLNIVKSILQPQLLTSKIFNDLNLTSVVEQYIDYNAIEVARLDVDMNIKSVKKIFE